MTNVLIAGGGAWGTALAISAVDAKCSVNLVVRTDKQADEINNLHTNSQYLANITLPSDLTALTYGSLESRHVMPQIVIFAVPSDAIYALLIKLSSMISAECQLIIASKGLDELNTNFFSKTITGDFNIIPSFLGGPNFAKELARKLPTAGNIANPDLSTAVEISKLLSTSYFTLYPIDDVITVQLAGCYKNSLAIYCGYIISSNLGENYRAQICTEAVKELAFISEQLGGNPANICSLAGIGDIMLTCFSNHSRNFQFGQYLARCQGSLKPITVPYLIEGVRATLTLYQLCSSFIDKLRIFPEIYKIIKLL